MGNCTCVLRDHGHDSSSLDVATADIEARTNTNPNPPQSSNIIRGSLGGFSLNTSAVEWEERVTMTATADDIACVVLEQFKKLPAKRKPAVRDNGLREWVPLSGIAVQGNMINMRCSLYHSSG